MIRLIRNEDSEFHHSCSYTMYNLTRNILFQIYSIEWTFSDEKKNNNNFSIPSPRISSLIANNKLKLKKTLQLANNFNINRLKIKAILLIKIDSGNQTLALN